MALGRCRVAGSDGNGGGDDGVWVVRIGGVGGRGG